jgi:hypothetical protein
MDLSCLIDAFPVMTIPGKVAHPSYTGQGIVSESHDLADHLESNLKLEYPRSNITIHIEPCNKGCTRAGRSARFIKNKTGLKWQEPDLSPRMNSPFFPVYRVTPPGPDNPHTLNSSNQRILSTPAPAHRMRSRPDNALNRNRSCRKGTYRTSARETIVPANT